jgi:putative ABC transport system substrate-binding protein
MRRREFITLIGGAAVWPLAAHAQQDGGTRRIGVLQLGSESDSYFRGVVTALREGLQQQGWIEGRNLRIDARYGGGDLVRVRDNVQELVRLAPEVIVVGGALSTRALQQRTQTIPIVFVQVGDPVSAGVVENIARPEGNTTGITNLFPSITGKWVELLKGAAPHLSRAALIFHPEFRVNEMYLAAIEAAAASLAVKAIKTPVRNATEIGPAIDAFATEPNGGLIVVPPPLAVVDRELIVRLAIQRRMPTISVDRSHATEGGLISYGPDSRDLYRLAASYVDRILRGAKPGDLPVQFPTKFEMVINLKTARAIGLAIPATLTALADEVIE